MYNNKQNLIVHFLASSFISLRHLEKKKEIYNYCLMKEHRDRICHNPVTLE